MVSREQWPHPNDASEARVIENIKRFGCHIVTVECDIRRSLPDFAYSIGFYALHSQPEVVVMGVSPQSAGRILNELNRRVAAGFKIDSSVTAESLFESKAFKFRVVESDIAADYVGFALWFYRHTPRCKFPVMQAIWPDRSGRFPGDPECHPKVEKIQSLTAFT